jgi:septal ring factor EnvC (AmiA/AmiB activator)
MSDTVNVRMLTSLAGDAFSHYPGEIVAVSPEIAAAWIAAGIADEPPHADALEGRIGDLEKALADCDADRTQLRDQVTRQSEELADLHEEIAAAADAAKEGRAAIERIDATVADLTAERDKAIEAAAAAAEKSVDFARQVADLTAALAAAQAPTVEAETSTNGAK